MDHFERKLFGDWVEARDVATTVQRTLKVFGLEDLMKGGKFLDIGCGDSKKIREIQKLYGRRLRHSESSDFALGCT